MNLNSKIFLAGHKGMIGHSILNTLKLNGYEKIITRDKKNLNLFNLDEVESFFKIEKPEYVILAAGKVGGILENNLHPFDFLSKNLLIQNNVLMSSIKYDVRKVIFFGSSCMYPKKSKQPMKEEYLHSGDLEKTSIGYAVAKISGLQFCLTYNHQFNKNTFLPLIPNSVYGPFDNFDPNTAHVLSSLIEKIHYAKSYNKSELLLWGSGNVSREFIFVDDVAEACLFLLKNDFTEDLPINIGTGRDVTIKSLANIISSIIGYEGKIVWDTSKPDGAKKKLLDSSKILKMGWRPKTSLEDGILKTYLWYKKKYYEKK